MIIYKTYQITKGSGKSGKVCTKVKHATNQGKMHRCPCAKHVQ